MQIAGEVVTVVDHKVEERQQSDAQQAETLTCSQVAANLFWFHFENHSVLRNRVNGHGKHCCTGIHINLADLAFVHHSL